MKKREKEDDIYLKKLGNRIKIVRKEKGIKQVALGYSCDLDKSNMNRIEAGNTNPSILLLKKIAFELGVPVSDLLNFDMV
jgi:transcriptional regulator with XRE-family HTH domain